MDDIRGDLAKDKLIWPSVPSVVFKIRKTVQDPDASADDITRAASIETSRSKLKAEMKKVSGPKR